MQLLHLLFGDHSKDAPVISRRRFMLREACVSRLIMTALCAVVGFLAPMNVVTIPCPDGVACPEGVIRRLLQPLSPFRMSEWTVSSAWTMLLFGQGGDRPARKGNDRYLKPGERVIKGMISAALLIASTTGLRWYVRYPIACVE